MRRKVSARNRTLRAKAMWHRQFGRRNAQAMIRGARRRAADQAAQARRRAQLARARQRRRVS